MGVVFEFSEYGGGIGTEDWRWSRRPDGLAVDTDGAAEQAQRAAPGGR
jgi:hypothetical protein